ncbi:anti-sigma factor antagonist [Sporosarcina sp. E16_8]|uniref:anti-sigma factor antagonist n=1 Tax=Sporosarcina sp. E16_8 TaxID=2789295 RepID=UPI001A90D360|nr:anti-sigma factor antagonist [Sporosarcina sp. E16_8]MBO0588508.1 anti-sigma factor antagonist [Sporosarcina sp. E16_8]
MADIEIIDNGILIATLQGELDNHEANRIRSHISSAIYSGQVRAVIWDLTRLGFMDSAGIGLILGRMRDLAPVEGETLILNPSTTMEKIFTFSGLGPNIRHCTVDLAIGEIGGVLHEQ